MSTNKISLSEEFDCGGLFLQERCFVKTWISPNDWLFIIHDVLRRVGEGGLLGDTETRSSHS